MVNLDEVLTFREAAEKWGLADGNTIRKAVERGKFEAVEIKKSGNVWLTTYDAMIRVFGEPIQDSFVLSYFELASIIDDYMHGDPQASLRLQAHYEKMSTMISSGKQVMIIESDQHPERILCILKNQEELVNWKKRLQVYFL